MPPARYPAQDRGRVRQPWVLQLGGLALLLGLLLCLQPRVTARDHSPRNTAWAAPRLAQPPEIDGVIGEEEWRFAAKLDALKTGHDRVSERPTAWFTAWDENHLYLAMRSPLRPGERLIRTIRRPGGDPNVVFDDSYEIWLDFGGTTPDDLTAFYQFLANAAHVRLDSMHLPTAGNQRMSWTADWPVAGRVTPDNVWEVEIAVPRSSVHVDEPFEAGQTVRMLLARNFKRPWEQNSVSGTAAFTATDTYAEVTLADPGPVVRPRGVADREADTFAFRLAIANAAAETASVGYRITSDGEPAAQSVLAVDSRSTLDAGTIPEPMPVGEGSYGIEVRDQETGDLLLRWSANRAFGRRAVPPTLDDRGDVAKLDLKFNPVGDYLIVDGDLIDYDQRDQVERFEVDVRTPDGEVIESKRLELDRFAYVSGTLQLPELAPGSYHARLRAYDGEGRKVIEEQSVFEKKNHQDFAWWRTDHGDWERVLDPWVPVSWDGSSASVSVLDRRYALGFAGLPRTVTSRGEDVLAEPVRLEIRAPDGGLHRSDRAASGGWTVRKQAEHRLIAESRSELGGLEVASRVTAEYDGMLKLDLTLEGDGPTDVASMAVVVPLTPEVAELYHASGLGIRSGFDFGLVPPGRDEAEPKRFWDSTRIDGQGLAVGSFVPIVWLGTSGAGLAWFADSDEGWFPSDERPAIELRRRDDGVVEMVLNLISEPVTLEGSRNITFAFQATPVKPMPPGWRGETWSTGDTFFDYQQVRPLGGHLIWTNIPFTLDPAETRKIVAQRHAAKTNPFTGDTPVDGLSAVPYLEWKHIASRFAPEVDYFADQWRAGSEGLWFAPSLRDYLVYHLAEFIEQTDIDGIYLDNVRPVHGSNLLAGQGYRLPDGRIQPTYQMFETRELFLRFRAVFQEEKKPGKFVLHMTNNFVVPWIGAADVLLDGEHFVVFAGTGTTFMDFWSPTRIRLAHPENWGSIVTFLQLHKGDFEPPIYHQALRAFVGLLAVHDVLPTANNRDADPFYRAVHAFGLRDPGVRFRPYWSEHTAVTASGDVTLASAWTHPEGRALVVAVNPTEKVRRVVLTLDRKALGLPSGELSIRDAELHHGIGGDKHDEADRLYLRGLTRVDRIGPQRVAVEIAGESYRLIQIEPEPEPVDR